MGKTACGKISPLKEDDLTWLVSMDRDSFSTAWTKAMWQEELQGRLSHYFAIRDNNNDVPVAFGGFWLVAGEAQVMRLAVDPCQRGKGWGLFLMECLMEEARKLGASEMSLEVREHNVPAFKTYLHRGFSVCGRRPRYYADTGEDALLMRTDL
jgi:ribosomal-protein-alanine N-acetyltransferase